MHKAQLTEKLKDQVEMTDHRRRPAHRAAGDAKGHVLRSGKRRSPPTKGRNCWAARRSNWAKCPIRISSRATPTPAFLRQRHITQLGAFRRPRQRRPQADAANGLEPDQVKQVRGYADQRLRKPEDPNSASNRRVSIVVTYQGAAP